MIIHRLNSTRRHLVKNLDTITGNVLATTKCGKVFWLEDLEATQHLEVCKVCNKGE